MQQINIEINNKDKLNILQNNGTPLQVSQIKKEFENRFVQCSSKADQMKKHNFVAHEKLQTSVESLPKPESPDKIK